MLTLHGAYAAESQSAEQSIEEIFVSATRVEREGFEAPTPVTVMAREQITEAATPYLADYLSTLPAFGAAMSNRNPTPNLSGGNTGLSLVNLRNLGEKRTLVLFNGQRVVSANLINSGVDMNLVPTALVERVDVVTGGASAAWGSDAVSGVVNVIINKKFTGIEASVEGSITTYGDAGNYKLDLAGGTDFAGGKGHVLGSATWSQTPGFVFTGDRPWFKYVTLMNNPGVTTANQTAANPRLIARSACMGTGTRFGVITSGPLKGTQFLGPNGTPAPFDFGIASGTMSTGPDAECDMQDTVNLSQPLWRMSSLGLVSYDLTDDITASLEIEYSHVGGQNTSTPYYRLNNLVIQRDNPFLDSGFRDRMTTLGLTSFTMGTSQMNMGLPQLTTWRKLFRSVFTVDGRFGDGWTWNAYYQRGRSQAKSIGTLISHIARYNAAVDSVRAANGQIQCRVNTDASTTNDMPGCVPLNPFGVPSSSAINYTSGLDTYQLMRNWQNVAAASISGEPVDTWAGPVSLATGLEYRAESAFGIADSESLVNAFFAGNPKGFKGKYNVKEGFAEVVVPLAKDSSFARNLDFNGAVRVTDYSTSGVVTTWKAGMTWSITNEYRLRGTRSRDIRAPNLDELFQTGSVRISVLTDLFATPPTTATGFFNTTGNPKLRPEKADTWSLGGVWSPDFIPGFQASIDWYSINVKDAIFSTGAVQVVENCFKGVTIFCKQLVRNSAGVLTQVDLFPENIAFAKTSGIDYEASYTFDLGPGRMNTRFLGTYYLEQSSLQNGVFIDNNGAIGGDTGGPSGFPKVRATATASYDLNPVTATLQARFVGKAVLNNAWTAADVDDNTVPAVVYLDLRGSYSFPVGGVDTRLYLSIDNLLDKDPPTIPITSTSALPFLNAAMSRSIHDSLGRTFRLGVRAKI